MHFWQASKLDKSWFKSLKFKGIKIQAAHLRFSNDKQVGKHRFSQHSVVTMLQQYQTRAYFVHGRN